MSNFNINLYGTVNLESVRKSISNVERKLKPLQLDFQFNETDIQRRINSMFQTTGGKSAFETGKIFTQFDKFERKIEGTIDKIANFDNKLLQAKNSGAITGNQFDNLSNTLNRIRNQFNNSGADMNNYIDIVKNTEKDLNKLNIQFGKYKAETQGAIKNTNKLGDAISKFTMWYLVAGAVTAVIRQVKDIIEQVKLLDSALVELNKVTDLTTQQMDDFVQSAFDLGKQLRTTGVDVINAATEFARAGYSAKEALDLSEVAIKLTNVAEGITDTSEASNILISVLKGAGFEFNNFNEEIAMANLLLDQLNEISNNNAVSFDELASMIQSSSATMATLGNTTKETLSLLTGSFEVLQDTRVAKGISTIGLRIAGLNEDLSTEAGLASQVGDALMKYANINVFDEQTQQLRSTYDILSELAGKWDNLTKNAQAYLTTTVAGKNRADVLNALMQNWQGVENAMEDATNALGSADKEMSAYYDSIEAHIESLKNSWQELATDFSDSDTVKFFIDLANSALKLVDNLGGLQAIMWELLAILAIIKLPTIITGVKTLGISVWNFINQINNLNIGMYQTNVTTKSLTLSVGTLQVALGALVGIISVVILVVNKLKQAEEERKRAIEETYKSAISNYENEMNTLKELEDQYLSLYNKTNKTESQKEQLITLTEKLAKAYGLEEKALASLNGEMMTNEELYSFSIDKKLSELIEKQSKITQAYNNAQKELSEIISHSYVGFGVPKDLVDKYGLNADIFNGSFTFKGTQEEYLNFLKDYRDLLNEVEDRSKDQENLLSGINENITELTEKINNQKEVIKNYEETVDLQKFYSEASDELVDLQLSLDDFNNSTLQEQADSYKNVQKEIDNLLTKYGHLEGVKDLVQGITKSFDEQVDIIETTDFLLNQMQDELETLQALKEKRDEELEQQEKLLKVEEARAKLAEAMNKKVRVYRAGQGFVYESDYSEVQDAQEDLAEAIRDAELDDLSQAIKNLTNAIEIYNKAQSEQGDSNALREYFMSSANRDAFMALDYESKLAKLKEFAPNVDWKEFLNGQNYDDVNIGGWVGSDVTTSNNIEGVNTTTSRPIGTSGVGVSTYNPNGVSNSPTKYITRVSDGNPTVNQNFGNIVLPNVTNAQGFVNELQKIGFVSHVKK